MPNKGGQRQPILRRVAVRMEGVALVLGRRGSSRPATDAQVNAWTIGKRASYASFGGRFAVLERGSKMLYLNTTVRGYPHGLRAGKDPRAPIISIDAGFEKVFLSIY